MLFRATAHNRGLVWNSSGAGEVPETSICECFVREYCFHYEALQSTGEVRDMEERDFFNETTEQRTHTLNCPKCGQAGEYKVTWIVRRKRAQLPRHADERDRAKFAKAQSYMVRRDDKLSCTNVRCRKPFEITSLQSLAFLNE